MPRRRSRNTAGLGFAVLCAVGWLCGGCAGVPPPSRAQSPERAGLGTPVESPDAGRSSSPFVTTRGTQLVLGGELYRPVGLDAYELATDWGENMGCGGMFSDAEVDQLFSSLPSRALVRIWAWQGSMATDPSGQRDWRPLDRIVGAAERHGIELVMSLGSQHGDCDDGRWKDAAWYEGGYRSQGAGDGYSRVSTSFWTYVHEVVARYAGSPAVAMWEPINEPEASSCDPGFSMAGCYGHLSCPDESAASAALRSFFDAVGDLIHSIDRNHLIESGAIGGPQCGWDGADAARVDASPGLDVASVHQDSGSPTIPAELSSQLAASRSVGKPLIVGELGVDAAATAGQACPSLADRAVGVAAATSSMEEAGVAAILLWNYEREVSGCGLGVGPGDPVLDLLRGTDGR